MVTLNKIFDPINENDMKSDKINLTLIFAALKDHRLHVRTTAADCINECIRMISQREHFFFVQRKNQPNYLDMIYTQVHTALFDTKDTDVNYQQSTLSILSELIQVKGSSSNNQSNEDNNVNIIMKNEKVIINKILSLIENSKAMQVKKQCIELLP